MKYANEFLGKRFGLNVKSRRARSLKRKKQIAGKTSNLACNTGKGKEINERVSVNAGVRRGR